MKTTHETAVDAQQHPDRWSKNLVGTAHIPTTHGFNLGVAEYHATDFEQKQVHEDQEALYVVAGVGEVWLDGEVYTVGPGTAIYVGPGVTHSTRRTGPDPVKVVYTHGAV